MFRFWSRKNNNLLDDWIAMILVREGERRETQATSAAVAVATERTFHRRSEKGGGSYLLILLKAQVKAIS
jgi:hypothetical protein